MTGSLKTIAEQIFNDERLDFGIYEADDVMYEIVALFSPNPFGENQEFFDFLDKVDPVLSLSDQSIGKFLRSLGLMAQGILSELNSKNLSYRNVLERQIQIYEISMEKLNRMMISSSEDKTYSDPSYILAAIQSGDGNTSDAVGLTEDVAENIFLNAKYFSRNNGDLDICTNTDGLRLLNLGHRWRIASQMFFGLKLKYYICSIEDNVPGVVPKDRELAKAIESGRVRHINDLNEYAVSFANIDIALDIEIGKACKNVEIIEDLVIGIDKIRKSACIKLYNSVVENSTMEIYSRHSIYYDSFQKLSLDGISFYEYFRFGLLLDKILQNLIRRYKYFGLLRMKKNSLISFIMNSCNCTRAKANLLVNNYVFKPESEGWIEVWDRPFYLFSDYLVFSPSIASSRSYVRAFENWSMAYNKKIFSEMGAKAEDRVEEVLKGKMDKVLKRKKVKIKGNKTEFDILAIHEETLYIFEVKFVKSIFSVFDIRALTEKMREAEDQLVFREKLVNDNIEYFSNLLGGRFTSVQKVMIVSNISIAGYNKTGSDIIYTDLSTLEYLFKDFVSYTYEASTKNLYPIEKSKFIYRNEPITSSDIIKYLRRPLNAAYFYDYVQKSAFRVKYGEIVLFQEEWRYVWGDIVERHESIRMEFEMKND